MPEPERRLPVGAEVGPGGVHFRVWAPRRQRVDVQLEGERSRAVALQAEREGYFSGWVEGAAAGTRYRYRLDGGEAYPDPASRFQPEGPHGPSEVIDPAGYSWQQAWPGPRREGQVIYELHLGTFTRAGTWAGAEGELGPLADLGVTVLEIMPIADFPGRFGWGYDGVNLFAPCRLYGRPDDFRHFVDAAHAAGLSVILDVVYNHLGPDGNYLPQYSAHYFTDRHRTDWGEPLNYDGEGSGPVRELFVSNAGYWIDEYRLDGLRLDATQDIFDESPDHLVAVAARRARAAAGERSVLLVAENEPQDTRLVRSAAEGGYGLDAVWNDDFHHTALVALTGSTEAYYHDYRGTPQELISALKYGYLYQGQLYGWQKKRRGTPTAGVPPAAFVTFIQNHDQVANSARGRRVSELTSPGRYRALTALMLLGPGTPLLFMGQEWAASSPFLFFADHQDELGEAVARGRRQFLAQWRSLALPEWTDAFANPASPETFSRCQLDHSERDRHPEAHHLHCDLLRLRREDAVFASQAARGLDGAVLGAQAFVLRFFGEAGEDRLLLVNLGVDLRLDPAPEPLLAPPLHREWQILWSSEARRYGGRATPALETEEGWQVPGEAAVVLHPQKLSP